MLTSGEIAEMLDYSLLKPELTIADLKEGCKTAKEYGVAAVCVKPADVPLAAQLLSGSGVLVTAVVGFPHGSSKTDTKVFEAWQAIRDGAVELDMVINYGRLLSGDTGYVENDIKAVVDAAHKKNALVKVILENSCLTDELKIEACRICERAGADFVKTSTGFGSGGATIPDLELMRANCSEAVRVKASGGVSTLDRVLEAKSAGATRIGTSAVAAIMDEAFEREKEGIL
jgi:deoxyribose-phosphate aldolase